MVQRRGPFDLWLRLVELLDAPVDAVGNGGVGERVQVRRLHTAPRFLDDARLRHVDDLTHGTPPHSERMIYRGRLRMPPLEVLMTLRERLDTIREASKARIPAEARAVMERSVDDLRASGIMTGIAAVGQKAPDFALPDAAGRTVSLAELRARGPVVLSFYRGRW
ncbi:MAG: hypothetical protein DME05_08450 [Candidatus Rokuibacteriota bacterium]|nr:MAG: hypothetical protein DME05_08450 [Candidatus Rokubacteria bacterium]